MPGFRSRKEITLTAVVLALGVPGAIIDLVLLADMVVHGRAVATAGLSWSGDLATWADAWIGAEAWLAGAPVRSSAATLVLLAAMLLGLPVALALVFGLPAVALAYAVRKVERSG